MRWTYIFIWTLWLIGGCTHSNDQKHNKNSKWNDMRFNYDIAICLTALFTRQKSNQLNPELAESFVCQLESLLTCDRPTQPSLLQIRWTWVSTQIPWTFSQATFMICKIFISIKPLKHGSKTIYLWHKLHTRCAILGPIPGNTKSSCKLLGISPLYLSWHIFATFFK
jgi:hypothetical protein